jgi:amidophosphoribosyltransferase
MKPPERFNDIQGYLRSLHEKGDKDGKIANTDDNNNLTRVTSNGSVRFEEGFTEDSPPDTPVISSDVSPFKSKKMTSEQKEKELVSRLLHLMSITHMSYSLIIMYDECLYAIRDPYGNRPLCIGMLFTFPEAGIRSSQERLIIDGWVVSSESCSFPSVSAKTYRDVEPGEIVKLERNKLPKTIGIVPRPDHGSPNPAFCIVEHVYFASPSSVFDGQMVYSVRVKCGVQLAIESLAGISIPADNAITQEVIVAPIPETSIPAALGFSKQSGIPYVEVFSRNRYVGRTFIQPSARLRRLGVSRKFGPLSANFAGKRIILIDDSIVRGTTIGQLVKLLKEFGAKEVHIRIASPPLQYPCYMGINIPTREELIANHHTPQELAEKLGAASLVHLSVEGLRESVESGIRLNHEKNNVSKPIGHCMACLTGNYPVKLDF